MGYNPHEQRDRRGRWSSNKQGAYAHARAKTTGDRTTDNAINIGWRRRTGKSQISVDVAIARVKRQ